MNIETGRFVAYGDNKFPGRSLHGNNERHVPGNGPRKTKKGKKGNVVLREVFDSLYTGQREEIPPFLVFTSGLTIIGIFASKSSANAGRLRGRRQ